MSSDDDKLRAAGAGLIGATVARRDARRLVDAGFTALVKKASKIVEETRDTHLGAFSWNGGPPKYPLETAIELIAIKEACDLVDLYDRDPDAYPDGRNEETAYRAGRRLATGRYRRGKCALCGGPAGPCAVRHAQGRSCA